MKTTTRILILIGLFIIHYSNSEAQTSISEGRIEYEVKVNMHKNIPKEREEMKAMIPEYNTFRTETYFNSNESLSRPVEEDEDPEAAPAGGRRMRWNMSRFLGVQYVNSDTEIRLSQMDFMGKTYLITDTLNVLPWKFSDEEKNILGYTCKLAIYYDTAQKQTINAWYTMQLRPYMGPDVYGTLPGTVLELEMVERATTMTAVVISDKKLRKNDIQVPSSGTKVTRSEFNALMKEQLEKMRQNGFNIQRN